MGALALPAIAVSRAELRRELLARNAAAALDSGIEGNTEGNVLAGDKLPTQWVSTATLRNVGHDRRTGAEDKSGQSMLVRALHALLPLATKGWAAAREGHAPIIGAEW